MQDLGSGYFDDHVTGFLKGKLHLSFRMFQVLYIE
jgi:hypothetical protein